MQPFVINRHDRLVFPSNFIPDLDFSVIATEEQLDQVIRRDFETKAPSGTEIGERIANSHYKDRTHLMRDVALNLFWVNRFAMTMYEKVPTRWRDVPRNRGNVFLPVVVPWQDKEKKVGAVAQAWADLPSAGDAETEQKIWDTLFDIFSNRVHHASALVAVQPTVARGAGGPEPADLGARRRTTRTTRRSPSPTSSTCRRTSPSSRRCAAGRWCCTTSTCGTASAVRLTTLGELQPDDVVVVLKPKSADVERFIDGVKGAPRANIGPRVASFAPEIETKQPIRPYPAIDIRKQFKVLPKIESLAVVRGEILCSNDDLIRNTAYCWSPMTADEISYKTGIETRMYSKRGLDELSLDAAKAALQRAGPAAGGDRGGRLLLLHEPAVDAVDGHLAVRAAGHAPDPHVGGHHRRLRRPALRAVRVHPAAAGGQPAGAAGLRREVLRQDRHRPAVPDDLR